MARILPVRPRTLSGKSATRVRTRGCHIAHGSCQPHYWLVLDAFIAQNRATIISRTRKRVALRMVPKATDGELTNGIPVFLDQLGNALRLARESTAIEHGAIGTSARLHGRDLLAMGLTIGQVVHDYGDVCQVVTELALEQKAPLSGEEFRTLNLCLDDAIAEAVTAFAEQRERTITDEGTERLGVLAHELRNALNVATLAYSSIKNGIVAPGGSTGLVLSRSLSQLRDLIDRSLADVRLDAGIDHHERIAMASLIEEVEIGAMLQAEARGINLAVDAVDPTLTVEGDRQILASALSNLLQNALKFTRPRTNVSLRARGSVGHVLVEVEDECGGLPPGKAEELFQPFSQRSGDRTGLGLGLSISRKAAVANGGALSVRDLPGKGCVFTLDLPRTA
jgi:signal transduction histidine kinase